MKAFSHPGDDQMSPADVNGALENTLVVATSEWKYVATTHLDLDPDLPTVPCYLGELNQVFLNIVVNAAHAIADAQAGRAEMGKITITTRCVDKMAEVRIADTGTGMPDHIRSRIFDPFFTTKEVGKGTGQGLSIAYKIVVNRHNGAIDVESVPGAGTTFVIRLPLSQRIRQDDDPENLSVSA